MSSRIRIDQALVRLGLAPSREKAQALLLANQVLYNDQPVTKAGFVVELDAEKIRLRAGAQDQYVSRGAHKLIAALDQFKVDLAGKSAIDLGMSTGGFTQVLLERGAMRVVGVDVGHNQLAWSLRQDPRIRLIEKTNARNLTLGQIGETAFDVIVGDLSFISLTKILAAAVELGHPRSVWIFLIKPQFEVGREHVGKGGIVRDIQARQKAVEQVIEFAKSLRLFVTGLIESPIQGTDGNVEYLACFTRDGPDHNGSVFKPAQESGSV